MFRFGHVSTHVGVTRASSLCCVCVMGHFAQVCLKGRYLLFVCVCLRSSSLFCSLPSKTFLWILSWATLLIVSPVSVHVMCTCYICILSFMLVQHWLCWCVRVRMCVCLSACVCVYVSWATGLGPFSLGFFDRSVSCPPFVLLYVLDGGHRITSPGFWRVEESGSYLKARFVGQIGTYCLYMCASVEENDLTCRPGVLEGWVHPVCVEESGSYL